MAYRKIQIKVKKLKALKLFKEGLDNAAIAQRLNLNRSTVVGWRAEWEKEIKK